MTEQLDWQTLEQQIHPEEGDIYTLEVRAERFTIHRYNSNTWEQQGSGLSREDIATLVHSMQFLGETKGKRRYYRPAGVTQPMSTQPEATLWATSTDLKDSQYERKRYFILIRDSERTINFSLVHTPFTNAMVAEPYGPPDYDYTIHDHCDYEADECVLDDPDFEEHYYGPQPETVLVEERLGRQS